MRQIRTYMSLNEEMISRELNAILCGDIERAIDRADKSIIVRINFKKLHSDIYAQAYSTCDDSDLLSLTNQQLANLIEFFTLFEKKFYFRGSASLVPQLIIKFKQQCLDGYEELVNHIIKLNDGANPYIPFGGLRSGECKSLKDYEEMLLADARRLRSDGGAEFRHSVRLELQKIKDAKNIWGAIRRKDVAAIKVMLDRGLDLSAINKDGITVQQALAKQEMNF